MTWSIKDYSVVAADNTEINGIDISDETGMPGMLNNATRQVMADIANSALCNFELFISEDSNNALRLGSDGKLFASVDEIANGIPAQLLSKQLNNAMKTGADGKLYLSASAVSSIPWTQITGKPSKYKPTSHASTHGANGTDPLSSALNPVPSKSVWLWAGTAESIPAGYSILSEMAGCFPKGQGTWNENGTKGGKTVADEFTSSGWSMINGVRSFSINSVADKMGYLGHSHPMPATTEDLYPSYNSSHPTRAFKAGYPVEIGEETLVTNTSGEKTHNHQISGLSVSSIPSYYALYCIIKN